MPNAGTPYCDLLLDRDCIESDPDTHAPVLPSAIAKTLPPSIEDIVTPIGVIFVGSDPPSAEWLKTKATPLIVQKERVMKALDWLKIHNHLYRNVAVDREVLRDHDDNVPPSRKPPHPHVSTISSVRRPLLNLFQSVVVADLDGDAPSRVLRSEALKHLKKPGSNYVEIPHDPKAVNEFNNPHLFPMIYPTLFPYGLGDLEDLRRRSPLSFKRHIKHFFNLADRRFQEHNSFLFTSFNTVQRRALLLRTSMKVKRDLPPGRCSLQAVGLCM
ncbi:hypothetical protein DFH09DRAFT_1305950 [Mycena vulgaris]|nr:hypothetical protein DFH09DRAFT_1305950 [Mycena vulgaris]